MTLHMLSYIVYFAVVFLLIQFVLLRINISQGLFIILNFFIIVVTIIIAYTFVPTVGYDLSRYFVIMDNMQNFSWEYVSEHGIYSATPFINFIMYAVSQLGNNHLLSPIAIGTVLTIITCCSYIYIFKHKNIVKTSTYSLYLFLVISILGLYNTMSGIRQGLAWSFMLIAVFYDFYGKKNNLITKLFLYVLPLTIHYSVIIVPLVKLFSTLIIKAPKASLLMLTWPNALGILPSVYVYLPSVMKISVDRLFIYADISTINMTSIYLDLILYIILTLLIVSIYRGRKVFANERFMVFYATLLFFGFSSMSINTLGGRTLDFLVIISLPVIGSIATMKSGKRIIYTSLLLIIGVLFFARQDVMPFLINHNLY